MKTAALIPCRKGSKGIPGKNFKKFNGIPLYEWTLKAAVESGVFDLIILSSDGGLVNSDGETLVPVRGSRVAIDNERPHEFATDKASLDELLVHYAAEHEGYDLWSILQPTSPLRTAEDIKKAHKMVSYKKYDSLVSVTPGTCMYWVKDAVGVKGENLPIATYHIHKRPNRQDRTGWFRENGAIYFTKFYTIDQTRCRLGGKIALFEMPPDRSLEIDSPLDWKICEFVGGE